MTDIHTGAANGRASVRWVLGVLVDAVDADERRVVRAHLDALSREHRVDLRLVPFESLDDLARDLKEGCLDAVFAIGASETPLVEGQPRVEVLTFETARRWFVGRASRPGSPAVPPAQTPTQQKARQ